MTLSKRELYLAGATVLILVFGGSFLLGQPLVRQWKNSATETARLRDENRLNARLIRQQDELTTRLEAIRSRLPRYRPNQQVKAELMQTVKRLADQHQVALTRMEPEEEKQVGDLSEIAINCQWEGSLESVTRLLYAVQADASILDVRQLSIAPAQAAAGRLKGTFAIHCAFSRTDDVAKPAAPAAPPAGS